MFSLRSRLDSREGSRRYGFVSFTKEVCVRSSEYVFKGLFKSFIYSIVIVYCIETTSSNVSLYRIDFTGVTNRLRLVSKRLVSKRLCIETTGFRLLAFYVVTLGPAVISTVCKYSSKFLSRISYLSSYVSLQRRRSFTLRWLYVCLKTW